MQKINLLYIITKLELGGAQKQLLTLISNLNRERFNMFLFTARDGLLVQDALSISDLKLIRSKWLDRSINPLKDSLALFEISRFIKKNNIQIIHTHSSKAGILGRLAARLAKVEVIIHTVHGWSFNDYQPFFTRYIFTWLERLAAKFTHKLIVVSNHDKEKGVRNKIGQEYKYQLIRYAVDYSEFSRVDQKIREELRINTSDLVVSMVSCFKPQKSPQDFIKLAFLVNKILPNVKFILVGDGVLRKEIERLIHKLGLEKAIILTGWRQDVYRILSITDIFVLTSLWDGLPITVLEAMAASIPVVATDTGGIREVIIEGKTGFLVRTHDMKTVSERLFLLLRDKNLRVQMGQNAKNNLGFDFKVENMVNNSQDLYYNLCN